MTELFFQTAFFIMGNEQSSKHKSKKSKSKQKKETGPSPIPTAKALISNGDMEGAVAALKGALSSENPMVHYDYGFMMMQGIGCYKDIVRGISMMNEGHHYEDPDDQSWRADGSITELLPPQKVCLADEEGYCEFFFLFERLFE